MNYNTPSYYPQSPHWGAHASPGGADYYSGAGDNDGGVNAAFSRPGSEHNPYHSKPGTPRNDSNWGIKHE